jgi:hypothetical protein
LYMTNVQYSSNSYFQQLSLRAGVTLKVVENLPSKADALTLNLSTDKKRNFIWIFNFILYMSGELLT